MKNFYTYCIYGMNRLVWLRMPGNLITCIFLQRKRNQKVKRKMNERDYIKYYFAYL